MRVLIIEDEPLAAEHLARLIHRYESHIQIPAMLDTTDAAVEWLKKEEAPDLILMDIRLADGLSFGIFDRTKLEVPVIFTTAYDEYTLRAFKVNSVDYLLKPISFEELAAALDKFVRVFWKKVNPPNPLIDIDQLRRALATPQKSYKERFVVRQGEKLHAISTQDILYFYSEDKVSLFRTRDNRRLILDETLNELEGKVDPQVFFRINRKYLIRFEAIEEIVSFSNRRLKVILTYSDDKDIIVSREKVSEFKQWLDR